MTAWVFGSLAVSSPQAHATGGVPIWTNRYDGPGNGDDTAYGLAVDSTGGVVVTGPSWNGTSSDFATIKYSNAGVPIWTNRYNGPGDGDDISFAVAVDSSNNVVVTGGSTATNGFLNFATIKYSSGGVPMWTNFYDGPGHGDDTGYRLVVDGGNNVIVAGASSNGSNDDYASIKYSSAGTALWTNRYNGPANDTDSADGLAVYTNGEVFVTGPSVGIGTYYDFATVAYSGTGAPLWTNRYNDGGASADSPVAVAVDGAGNVFVAGSSDDVTTQGYTIIKYLNSGVQVWSRHYYGPMSQDEAVGLAMDAGGDVVVTGRSWDGFTWDYATMKYSNGGVPMWTNRYDGPGDNYDTPAAVTTDSSGNVVVTGYSTGTSVLYGYATVAYSSAGVALWTNRFEGPGNDNEATAMAVDKNGNVFVTGLSDNGTGSYDFATIKYSSSVSAAPHLDFQRLNNQLVLSWADSGFHLQSAPLVTGTYTNIPSATDPYTNSFSGAQQYFRLQGN